VARTPHCVWSASRRVGSETHRGAGGSRRVWRSAPRVANGSRHVGAGAHCVAGRARRVNPRLHRVIGKSHRVFAKSHRVLANSQWVHRCSQCVGRGTRSVDGPTQRVIRCPRPAQPGAANAERPRSRENPPATHRKGPAAGGEPAPAFCNEGVRRQEHGWRRANLRRRLSDQDARRGELPPSDKERHRLCPKVSPRRRKPGAPGAKSLLAGTNDSRDGWNRRPPTGVPSGAVRPRPPCIDNVAGYAGA
jgi:hypothetical protein